MIYGITGNPHKELLWRPVADVIGWMLEQDIRFRLQSDIAVGLQDRGLVAHSVVEGAVTEDLARESEIVLSFGGDGTLLNTASSLCSPETPILGVNVGRLGFLTSVEAHSLREAIGAVEAGRFEIVERAALEAMIEGNDAQLRALNEILVTRTGSVQMIEIEVKVDGALLNRYWADGLIVATSTGSTAYSLSVGGPIVAPGAGVVVVSPIAPHTLTMRPVILPEESVISIRVTSPDATYLVAADGQGHSLNHEGITVTVSKSDQGVRLVKLEGWDYFDTLRKKLAWGAGG